MVMVGADVDELERLAVRMAEEARRLDLLGATLSRQLQTTPWRGARSDRFRAEWRTRHIRQLREAAGFLRHGGDVLAHNARQQRHASSAVSGSGHGPSGTSSVSSRPPMSTGGVIAVLLSNPHDAQSVLDAWNRLSPAERAAIIREHPEAIGNLDGIPPDVRFAINRARVRDYLDGLASDDPMRQELSPYVTAGNGPSQILFFDPTGDGRIAVVRGDLSSARNVAVVVPGIGNEMSHFGGMVGDADQLRYSAGPGTAVIAWLGYDTPPGIANPGVIAAAGTGMALAGAPLLVSLVGGLRTSTDATITVVGHSYGSLVTGEAAKRGLDADRIVFIGSPGPGAENVAGLRARPGTEVFAGAIEGDPVSNLRHFGNDPTDPRFGAIAFDAGHPIASVTDLHSLYYDPGSVSLDNLGNIVSGRPVSLDHASPMEQAVSQLHQSNRLIDSGIDHLQQRIRVPLVGGMVNDVVDVGQGTKDVGVRVGEIGGEAIDDAAKKSMAIYKAVTPSWLH